MNDQCQSLSNFSHLRLKSKRSDSHSSETISKYFKPLEADTDSSPNSTNFQNESIGKEVQNFMEVECPYENYLTNVDLNNVQIDTSATEENDFKTPKRMVFRSPSTNITVKRSPVKKKTGLVKRNTRSRQTILSNGIDDDLHALDFNPEHLQLAVALSRSEQDELESANAADKTADSSKPVISTTLEQFGFGSTTNKVKVQHRKLPIQKKKKSSKYRYVRPILFIRTEADRQQLIAEKVSTILSENYKTNAKDNHTDYNTIILSRNLKKYWNKNADIFKISSTNFTNAQSNDVFYVKTLTSILPNNTKCGGLLRNWSSILGRPLSPTSTNSIETELNEYRTDCTNRTESTSKSKSLNVRCISPDLFDSDDDEAASVSYDISNCNKESACIQVDVSLKEYNLNADEKSTTGTAQKREISESTSPGILTIESYSKNEHELAKSCFNFECKEDVVDLTLSSDDEFDSSATISNFNQISVISQKRNLNLDKSNTLKIVLENSIDIPQEGEFASSSKIASENLFASSVNNDILSTERGPRTEHELAKNCVSVGYENLTQPFFDELTSAAATLNYNKASTGTEQCNLTLNESYASYSNTPKSTSQNGSYIARESEIKYSSPEVSLKSTSVNLLTKNESNGSYSEEFAKNGYEENVMDLTQSSDDELNSAETNKHLQVSPRNSSLNITDYMYSVLNQQEGTNIFEITNEHQKDKNEVSVLHHLDDTELLLSNDVIVFPSNQSDEEFTLPNQNNCPEKPKLNEASTSSQQENTQNDKPGCSASHVTTPKNKVTIKTSNITPMVNYDDMSTPTIQNELNKFGLKPFKRRQGVKILQHIYEMTHPIGYKKTVSLSDDEDGRIPKRRKIEISPKKKSFRKHKSEPYIKASYLLTQTEPDRNLEVLPEKVIVDVDNFNFIGDQDVEILENCNEEENLDDLVFETIQSKKISSCRVPLHIVFCNLVSANPKLKKKILLYEPFVVQDLYKSLQALGYRFALKDLENFLHKKCITIKTKQNHDFGNQKKRRPKIKSKETT